MENELLEYRTYQTQHGPWTYATIKDEQFKKDNDILWKCKCDCGKEIVTKSSYLVRGIKYSCGCKVKLSTRAEDLSGKRVGKLIVTELGEDLILPNGQRIRRWKCKCDCGNETLVIHSRIKNELTKSCGCLIGKTSKNHKINKYEIIGDYAYISLPGTDKKAICDKDMIEKMQNYYWRMSNFGYVVSHRMGKCIRMHGLVIGEHNEDLIDHINRNKLDNRRENLRATSFEVNAYNRGLIKSNKSGYPGVRKVNKKWRSTITVNRKNIHLGYFETKEKAILARKEAEKNINLKKYLKYNKKLLISKGI